MVPRPCCFSLLRPSARPYSCAPTCQASPTIQLNLGNCTILGADQNDVNSWGTRIGVNGSSELCMVPSTVVNSTFLTTSEVCEGDNLKDDTGLLTTLNQCRSRRGGFVTRSVLSTAPIDGLSQLNKGWVGFGNVISYASSATLQLLTQSVTVVEGLITGGQMSTTSHMGLAAGSTLLDGLKKANLIGARSWGLNSGSQSVLFPRDGSLVLGGYDQASLAGPLFEYNVAIPDLLNNRYCPLQITITQLTLEIKTPNSSASQPIITNSNKLPVCVEPYDNLFRMPEPILDQVQAFFKQHTSHLEDPVLPAAYSNKILNLEPGIVYPSSAGQFNATLRFTINNGLTVDIPSYEFQRPLRGLDANGSVVLDPDYNELQIYGSPAPEDGPVVGKAFLSQLYLFVDYEKMKFYLANQNIQASTPLPLSSAESCPDVGDGNGLSPEAKWLAVVGSVLGALIVILVVLAFCKWCWKPFRACRRSEKEGANGAKSRTSPSPEVEEAATTQDVNGEGEVARVNGLYGRNSVVSGMEGDDGDVEDRPVSPSSHPRGSTVSASFHNYPGPGGAGGRRVNTGQEYV